MNRHATNGRTRPRRGFHLIEMLAVIGLTGLMITLCVLTIQGLLAADRSARRAWAEAAALERLASAFRRDLHEASKTPEITGVDRLDIDQGAGKSVEYRLKNGDVVVSRTRADAAGPSVETYRASKWRALRVDRGDPADGPLFRLVFQPLGRAGAIEMPIEATAGIGTEVRP